MTVISSKQLNLLKQWDTPTICNGLEIIDSRYAGSGFTTQQMICSDSTLSPIVGFARTATIKARALSSLPANQQEEVSQAYYRHMAEQPHPTIAVIQDLDMPPGFGAWWGEVHTTVHKGLGGLGVVTNGSIRDLDVCAPDFQMLAGNIGPSHGHVHVENVGCEVNIFSMLVKPGDIIHADRHGAVVIPHETVEDLPAIIEKLTQQEEVIINAARSPQFTLDKFFKARESTDTFSNH